MLTVFWGEYFIPKQQTAAWCSRARSTGRKHRSTAAGRSGAQTKQHRGHAGAQCLTNSRTKRTAQQRCSATKRRAFSGTAKPYDRPTNRYVLRIAQAGRLDPTVRSLPRRLLSPRGARSGSRPQQQQQRRRRRLAGRRRTSAAHNPVAKGGLNQSRVVDGAERAGDEGFLEERLALQVGHELGVLQTSRLVKVVRDVKAVVRVGRLDVLACNAFAGRA